MTSVGGSDAQPASTGNGSAMVPGTLASPHTHTQSGIERIKPNDYDDIIKLDESLFLNNTNWLEWREDILDIFRVCGVEGYVEGTLLRPDPNLDPEGAENWSHNDSYTRLIISLNVTRSQKENTLMCHSAREVWTNLEIANRSQASENLFAYGRELFHTTAGERDNIIEHLDKLKNYRLKTNFAALSDERLKIPDPCFNLIIARSLPPSWDYFTGRYVGTRTFIGDGPGTISSQRFTEIIEQEYRRRELCDRDYLARRPTHVKTYVDQ